MKGKIKTFELNEDSINMLSNCVIKQIESWSEIGEKVYPNKNLTELARIECAKLQTLLNYLNS